LHDSFYATVVGVGDPTPEMQSMGMVQHEAAEANTLNGAFNKEMNTRHGVR
jgi:hypothetical protein